MWRRERRLERSGLGDECGAFLAGHYAEYVAALGLHVPVWAWTNLLAHGCEEELRSPPGCAGARSAAAFRHWCRARRYLAGEVLDLGQRWGSLAQVQNTVLVPLELELAARLDTTTWEPNEWVTAVTVAL